jgi:hypothetical protein
MLAKIHIGGMAVTLTLLSSVFGALSVTAAPVITFDPNTGFTTQANVSQTVGWAFQLSNSFTVNQLGWYDQGGDGLGQSHPIGIWDLNLETLIVSATVPAGTAATLDGGFRMVSIPNTILASGQYAIGGLTDPNAGDLLYLDVTELVNPAVSWFGFRFSSVSGTLIYPGTEGQGVTSGLYGPMFGFAAGTPSTTPEPASFGLVGVSLLAAFLMLRKNLRFVLQVLVVAILVLTSSSVANALPSRTWVASNGLDGNPCSRSSPCASFEGALAKTAAGGEINCVDAGDYGIVVIDKAITIDCAGTLGSMLVPASGNGIFVTAGSNDVITLRNLSIDGGGNTGNNGIFYNAAAAVHLENISIFNIADNCVGLFTSGSALLTVDNSTISDCGFSGIDISTSSGIAAVNVNNTRISKTSTGIFAENGSRVTITNSTIYFNTEGVNQSGAALGSTVTAVGNTFGYSSLAALRGHSGPNFILAFGNNFVNDVLAFSPNGGNIYTGSDNNNSGSTAGTANGGSVPKI